MARVVTDLVVAPGESLAVETGVADAGEAIDQQVQQPHPQPSPQPPQPMQQPQRDWRDFVFHVRTSKTSRRLKLVHDVLLYPHARAATPRYVNDAANQGICVALSCVANHVTRSDCWILELSTNPGEIIVVAELLTASFPSIETQFRLTFPDDNHHPGAALLCAQLDKSGMAKACQAATAHRGSAADGESPDGFLADQKNSAAIDHLMQRTDSNRRDIAGLVQVAKNLTATTETTKAAINELVTNLAATKKDVDEANGRRRETDSRLEKLEREQATLKEELSKKKAGAAVDFAEAPAAHHHRRRSRSRRCRCTTRQLKFGDALRRTQEVLVQVKKGGSLQTMFSIETSKNANQRLLCTSKSPRPGFTKTWISSKDIMIKDSCDNCWNKTKC